MSGRRERKPRGSTTDEAAPSRFGISEKIFHDFFSFCLLKSGFCILRERRGDMDYGAPVNLSLAIGSGNANHSQRSGLKMWPLKFDLFYFISIPF